MEFSEFGNRLRELRKKRRLTQRELADKADIDFTYLSKIENGLGPPKEEKIIRIAKALGEDPEPLLLLAGKIPKSYRNMIVQQKGLPEFLRTAKEHGVSKEDYERLIKQIKKRKKKT